MSDLEYYSNVRGSCEKSSFLDGAYVFKWAIEKFPKWPMRHEFKTNSFEVVPFGYFFITLQKREVPSDQDGCTLRLVFESYTTNSIQIDHEISITDSAGKIFSAQDFGFYEYSLKSSKTMTLSSNEMAKFSNETQDQIIVLKFTFKYFNISTEEFVEHPMPSPADNLPTIVDNFKIMYDESLYTDLSLIVEGDVARVHKSVLCASSPVIAKMLSSATDEATKDAIEITDIEFPILKYFTEFLYTGNIPATDFESVYALYYAADKYDVPSLPTTCSKIMLAKLDIENACRVLFLANRHSDYGLKNSVVEFMKFQFDAIVKTDAWIEFAKSESGLAAEVKG